MSAFECGETVMISCEYFADHQRKNRSAWVILFDPQGATRGITSWMVTTDRTERPPNRVVHDGLKTKSAFPSAATRFAPPQRHDRLCFNSRPSCGVNPGAALN